MPSRRDRQQNSIRTEIFIFNRFLAEKLQIFFLCRTILFRTTFKVKINVCDNVRCWLMNSLVWTSVDLFFFLSSSEKTSFDEKNFERRFHFPPTTRFRFLVRLWFIVSTMCAERQMALKWSDIKHWNSSNGEKKNRIEMNFSSSINKILLLVALFVLICATIYRPLPKNFSQPWKYRFLSYGAAQIDKFVRFPSSFCFWSIFVGFFRVFSVKVLVWSNESIWFERCIIFPSVCSRKDSPKIVWKFVETKRIPERIFLLFLRTKRFSTWKSTKFQFEFTSPKNRSNSRRKQRWFIFTAAVFCSVLLKLTIRRRIFSPIWRERFSFLSSKNGSIIWTRRKRFSFRSKLSSGAGTSISSRSRRLFDGRSTTFLWRTKLSDKFETNYYFRGFGRWKSGVDCWTNDDRRRSSTLFALFTLPVVAVLRLHFAFVSSLPEGKYSRRSQRTKSPLDDFVAQRKGNSAVGTRSLQRSHFQWRQEKVVEVHRSQPISLDSSPMERNRRKRKSHRRFEISRFSVDVAAPRSRSTSRPIAASYSFHDWIRYSARRRSFLPLDKNSSKTLLVLSSGYIFAARLRSLNKKVYHHHFEDAFHGAHVFLYGPLRFEIAHQMIHHTAQALRNHFHHENPIE